MDTILDHRLSRMGEATVTIENAVTALAILVASWELARGLRWLVVHRLRARSAVALGTRYAIGRILGYIILFFGVTIALQALGVNLAALAVVGGAPRDRTRNRSAGCRQELHFGAHHPGRTAHLGGRPHRDR
ncbi:MAG: hypothetical protein ABI592_16600 [Acidobacteriota bacterium]